MNNEELEKLEGVTDCARNALLTGGKVTLLALVTTLAYYYYFKPHSDFGITLGALAIGWGSGMMDAAKGIKRRLEFICRSLS